MTRTGSRLLVAVAVAVATWALAATPAGADPAVPTDFRSRVLRVEPALPDGVELRVVGGDAFLELEVAAGHTVLVPDYASGEGTEDRPYLRFEADGTVSRNERSAAAAANEDRYGSGASPGTTGAEPRWEVVSRDGSYVWHDHRIHWMLPRTPTAVDARGRVDLGGPSGTWAVDLTVDGEPTTVRGELLLLASPDPLPWFALVAGLAGAVVAGAVVAERAGRRTPHRAVGALLGAAGVAATVAGWAQWRAIPPGAGGDPLTALVPAVASVAAAVAVVAGTARVRLVALALAVAGLGGWAVLRREVLLRAVLPTTLPFGLDRAATAVALGIALAGAIVVVWRPPVDRRPVAR